VARYNTGLVAGEHEKVSTKITLSIDVVKIVGKYVIEVEVVKSNFTVRDWLTVLENNMIYRKFVQSYLFSEHTRIRREHIHFYDRERKRRKREID
jgi:hypothetical protein